MFGCELHKNAFGGRALPGPAGGAIALSQAFSRYSGRGGRGREINIGKGIGREGRGLGRE